MPHTFSNRVTPMPDGSGYYGGFYTVDSTEFWTGVYKSQAMAQNRVDSLMTSAQARFDAELALVSLSPSTISAAAAALTVTVTGTGFVAGSVIMIKGVDVPTTFVNATTLTTSYDPTVAANVTFKVRNPDARISNGLPMTVTA